MKLRTFLSLWGPVLFLLGLLFYLSSLRDVPIQSRGLDKIAHFTAYGVLAVLWLRALHGGSLALRPRLALVALAFTIAYGASDELHQRLVGGRDASIYDFIADALGALVGVGVVGVVARLRLRALRTRLDPGGGV